MQPTMIEGHDYVIGAPPDWDPAKNGPIMGLPIKTVVQNGIRYAVSAWEPSPDDIQKILRGAKIHLWISAPAHPTCAMTIGPIPGIPEPVEGLTHVDTGHPLAGKIEVWDEDRQAPLLQEIREVDIVGGWADCYVRDLAGKMVMEGEIPAIKRLWGRFTIRWKQENV